MVRIKIISLFFLFSFLGSNGTLLFKSILHAEAEELSVEHKQRLEKLKQILDPHIHEESGVVYHWANESKTKRLLKSRTLKPGLLRAIRGPVDGQPQGQGFYYSSNPSDSHIVAKGDKTKLKLTVIHLRKKLRLVKKVAYLIEDLVALGYAFDEIYSNSPDTEFAKDLRRIGIHGLHNGKTWGVIKFPNTDIEFEDYRRYIKRQIDAGLALDLKDLTSHLVAMAHSGLKDEFDQIHSQLTEVPEADRTPIQKRALSVDFNVPIDGDANQLGKKFIISNNSGTQNNILLKNGFSKADITKIAKELNDLMFKNTQTYKNYIDPSSYIKIKDNPRSHGVKASVNSSKDPWKKKIFPPIPKPQSTHTISNLKYINSYHSNALKNPTTYDSQISLRMFLDPEHFDMAERGLMPDGSTRKKSIPIEHTYGARPFSAWEDGVQHIRNISTRPPTVDDFFDLHRITYGYPEARLSSFLNDRISQLKSAAQKRQALKLLAENKIPTLLTLLDLKPTDLPIGTLRDGPLGFATSSNSTSLATQDFSRSSDGFTPEQIKAFEDNPDLRVRSKKDLGDGKIKAFIQFPDHQNLNSELKKLFDDLSRQLSNLKQRRIDRATLLADEDVYDEAFLVLSKFYQKLLSMHFFWDGNGRVAKLIRDAGFLYLGYVPPTSTPSNDLELSPKQLAKKLKDSVPKTSHELAELDRFWGPNVNFLNPSLYNSCIRLTNKSLN